MAIQTISNAIGCFAFDDERIVEESLFSDDEILANRHLLIGGKQIEKETELAKKHNAKTVSAADRIAKEKFLEMIKAKHNQRFHTANILIAKEMIKNSVKEDNLLAQAVNDIEELEKSANLLSKRLREWYELYNPETSRMIPDHQEFIDAILSKSKDELQKEFDIKFTMGAPLREEHIKPMLLHAAKIKELYGLRDAEKKYVEEIMQRYFPNLNAVAGSHTGSKLIAQAGGIERLSMFPASTVQLLGAEKALFRHMKTGARPPKYGLIISHPLIAAANIKERGKVARAFANKLAIVAKVDFFKGEFVGDKIREELERKFKK